MRTLWQDAGVFCEALSRLDSTLAKGYPEFDPDQSRDQTGRWISGGGGSTSREVMHLLLARRKLPPLMAARRLGRRLAYAGYPPKLFRGRSKAEFEAWLKRTAKKVPRDVLMNLALGVSELRLTAPKGVAGWAAALEAALQADDTTIFPELLELLEASKLNDRQIASVAARFWGTGVRQATRTQSLNRIFYRWDKLQDFRRASASIARGAA